jgi:small-conductance mechanosensitive channel
MMSEFLQYKIFSLGNYSLTVAMILAAVLTWVLSWLLLRTLKRFIENSERIANLTDQGRKYSIFLLARYLVWSIAIAVTLEVIGMHVSVILAGSAALLVGLGLGVQQIFRDIMSGVFLLFEGTVEIGDVIKVDDEVGKIIEINLRTSKMLTRKGNIMVIPNHKFITENVMNWTHQDQSPSRFSVQFGTHYDIQESKVREFILDCVRQHSDIIQNDPNRKPEVRLVDFSDEKIIFKLVFWTYNKFEADSIRSEVRFLIREKLQIEGISMAKGA